jgi:hypothetical protein
MEDQYNAVKFAREADPSAIPLPVGQAVPEARMTPATTARPMGIPSHLLSMFAYRIIVERNLHVCSAQRSGSGS